MKIAMISYNAFASGNNGWKSAGDNHLLLLQNSKGEVWGTPQTFRGEEEFAKTVAIAKELIENNWDKLLASLGKIDLVIFYVGSYGAERAIELAHEKGLDPMKAVFVLCDCNYGGKIDMLMRYGFSSSRVIKCECGGHYTMRRIHDNFLETGEVGVRL